MTRPTLSVVMLNYNYGRYIEEAIQAILDQAYKPLEFIIIDDGSTDDSLLRINKLLRNVSYFKLISHSQNKGILYSLNEAVRICKGSHLYLASSDDHVEAGFFQKLMGFINRNPHIGLCCGDPMYFWDANTTSRKIHHFWNAGYLERVIRPEELPKIIRNTDFSIASVTCVYRVDLVRQYGGFSEKLKSLSDWYLMYQIAFRHPVGYLPYPLAATRIHQSSYSAGVMQSKKNRNVIFDVLIDTISKDCKDILQAFAKSGIFLYIGRKFVIFLLSKPRHWHLLFEVFRKKFSHILIALRRNFFGATQS